MSGAIQELFEAVRSACSAASWSRGVELARADAVRGERESGDEVVLRVSAQGGLVSPTVVLFPDDEEWDCDCASREEVCEHVAAAVIALRRARSEGGGLPSGPREAGHIGYRLARRGGRLDFERAVVGADGETLLETTLSAVSSGRVDGPPFLASQADVEVERALGSRLRGELPRGVWPSVLAALASCPDVRLDGTPVRATRERVGYAARLADRGDGFRLAVRRDPRVVEVFDGDVALLDDGTLCQVGSSRLSGRELELLRGGRHYAADEAAVLVTEVLPSLRERMPVEIATQRLPRTSHEPPRIDFEVAASPDGLSVLPRLVYGDPPTARVDAGRLVPLGGPVPLRDEAAERALLRRLQSELELAPGRRLSVRGEEALALADRLRRWPGGADLAALARFRREPPLEPELVLAERGFELRLVSTDDSGTQREASAGDALRAWRTGEAWAPLVGGGFAPLPSDWLARYGSRIADLLAARGERGELCAAALPELASLAEEAGLDVPPSWQALRERLLADEAPAAHALPDDLSAELRAYQRAGVAWLSERRELGLPALLADDMGLGKTLQALCAVRGRTLVVAPTSVLPIWAGEASRFRPALRVCTYHGAGRALDPQADLTLTTYAILRLDADALAQVSWESVVLDESQAIKNPESRVARAAFRLPGDFRLALTGTPIENRLEELWSQFRFLAPGWLGSRSDFEERYARPVAAGDAAVAERLRARVRPFVLRRLKRDVAPELPPRSEALLHVELDAEERRVYEAVLAATRREVSERLAGGASALQILEALLRLRQAACHAGLVPGQQAERSSKVDLLREVLEESAAEGHKALVFSQWTSLLDRVEPALREAGLDFLRLDGSTRDRAGVVEAFQRAEGPPVLLVSLRAGGSGLTLTAADEVFILDPWWNPAVEQQAADRAHRIGQTRPVMIYRLVATDTVEERVLALQERKRGLAEAALGEGALGASLDRDELLALLG